MVCENNFPNNDSATILKAYLRVCLGEIYIKYELKVKNLATLLEMPEGSGMYIFEQNESKVAHFLGTVVIP